MLLLSPSSDQSLSATLDKDDVRRPGPIQLHVACVSSDVLICRPPAAVRWIRRRRTAWGASLDGSAGGRMMSSKVSFARRRPRHGLTRPGPFAARLVAVLQMNGSSCSVLTNLALTEALRGRPHQPQPRLRSRTRSSESLASHRQPPPAVAVALFEGLVTSNCFFSHSDLFSGVAWQHPNTEHPPPRSSEVRCA